MAALALQHRLFRPLLLLARAPVPARPSVLVAAATSKKQQPLSRRQQEEAVLEQLYAQAQAQRVAEGGPASHVELESPAVHGGAALQLSQPAVASAPPRAPRAAASRPKQQHVSSADASAPAQAAGLEDLGIPNAQEAKNPTRLAFEPMYQQLVAWHAAHLTCHVPRNCFDAPPLLDAWVRHLRRLKESGKLEAWKTERLDLLGFEWEMSDVEAKWHNMYHQLRRFRAVHGHTTVPADYRNPQEPGWQILAR